VVAIAACASGGVGLGVFGIGGIRPAGFAEALNIASFALTILWFVILSLAAINLRWRALWLLCFVPVALFPLAFLVLFSIGIDRCETHHPVTECVP